MKRSFLFFIIGLLVGFGVYLSVDKYTAKKPRPPYYTYVGEDTLRNDLDYTSWSLWQEEYEPKMIIESPDVAVRVAEAILRGRFSDGDKFLVSERPYKVRLLDNHIWEITGQRELDIYIDGVNSRVTYIGKRTRLCFSEIEQ